MYDLKRFSERMTEALYYLRYAELQSGRRTRITYAELAARVSRAHGGRVLSASQVSKYEKGENAPPLDVILAYAKACGVDPGWLTYGADSAGPAPPRVASTPSVDHGRPPKEGALRRAAGGRGRGRP